MSFNDMGWFLAFGLAGLSLLQVVKNWADARFSRVQDQIHAGDKWYTDEIKSLRESMNRYNNDLYEEINRIEERIEKCENCPAPKEKNYYNSEA